MLTQSFAVSGMTCSGCVEKITAQLKEVSHIRNVQLDLASGTLEVESEKPVSVDELNRQLQILKKYTVLDQSMQVASDMPVKQQETREPWYRTYYPLMLVFAMSMGLPFVVLSLVGTGYGHWMSLAMGTSLVAIAFFKFLDLKKFAEGFSTYDPIAKKMPFYGWIYPFLELGAGILFLSGIEIQTASLTVSIILTVTSIGVISALRQKRMIECACLGTLFKLPLTKVTIVENAVMVTMALVMLFYR